MTDIVLHPEATLESPADTVPSPGPSPGTHRSVNLGCGEMEYFSDLVATILELTSSERADDQYEIIARQLGGLIDFDSFALLIFDEANRNLRFRWARGIDSKIVDHWTFGLGQGLLGRAAMAGQARDWSGLTAPEPAGVGADPDLLPGSGVQLALPLPGRGRCTGVLHLGRKSPDQPFEPRQVRLAELLARHLGHALESSCTQATTRRLARNLSLLQEASRELTSILDRDRLLEAIADIVARLVEHELFVVLLWDEDEQVLRSVFERRTDGVVNPQPTLELGQGLCGSAAALRQPVRVGNVQLDPRYVACTTTRQVKSELAVPLVFEGRLLGVLDVESYAYDAFDAEHEQMLATLGANVAVALENAGLYELLRRDERRLSRDLHTARQVQRFLLPRTTPWVPGLQIGVANAPARDLGGDIYDFYTYGDGRTAIAIGDVAGKGTGAALYGSLAIGLLRGFATDSRCCAFDAVTYLDQELRQLQVERRFLALAYAVYDQKTRQLEISNAGLPYPFLVRAGEVKEIELGALPLGAHALGRPRASGDEVYQRPTVTLDLEPGDRLVFITDGIDECLCCDGQPFGSERVAETLLGISAETPAEAVARQLIEVTDAYRGENEPSDDRTVVVLQITD